MSDQSQEFRIHVVSDADNSGFKSTAAAAHDLSKEMGVINVTSEDVKRATEGTSEAVKEGTEKFGESRREIREMGNELGRAIGVGGAGRLMLGGLAAAAVGAATAIEFLKGTWEDIQEAIKGPINVGLPEDAPAHISAAATAWNQYAAARAKVIAAQDSPEADASAQEKHLANELKLIKEVMDAEKEKALADLELRKGEMTPEAYAAAQAGIKNIFNEAGTAAEANNRQQLIANKEREAANLEIDARRKTQEALAIKTAPKAVAETDQKTLDANAAAAEKAKEEIQKNLDLIARQKKSGTGNIAGTDDQGGDVLEYEGAGGKLRQLGETWDFKKKYGYGASIEDARAIEETRLAQAQAQIDAARTYRTNEDAKREAQKKLMDEAGTESGKAAGLRQAAGVARTEDQAQRQTDAHVAQLHQASANHIAGASAQTVAAVQHYTATTVGGFQDVHAVFTANQRQLNELRGQIRQQARNK